LWRVRRVELRRLVRAAGGEVGLVEGADRVLPAEPARWRGAR